jgi:predicted TIM-barrel fold metal-dependent hydrolase
MELCDVHAIDTLSRAFYCEPEVAKPMFKFWELQQMTKGTFGGVAKRLGLKPGEEWKVLGTMGPGSVQGVVKEMDEVGVQYMFIDSSKAWSRRDHGLWSDWSIDLIKRLVDESGGKFIGGASYNPFRIKESLEEIDRALELYGCKYIWAHPISFGLRPDDKKMYPLYTKCMELGMPVSFQVGHSAEALPSEPGHPMNADEVAMDFPDLTIILTHTGFPWIHEWISMVWRHHNVFGSIGAYYPSDLDPAIVDFMNGRGQNKVMWATNGFGLTRCKKEFLELPLKDEVKKKILRDNAVRVFKLE